MQKILLFSCGIFLRTARSQQRREIRELWTEGSVRKAKQDTVGA